MAKKIYPGNYVNRLSSYQGQPVVAIPGRVYYHITGYALVSSTGGTSFDITIPSPDRRQDDKPRPDITSLVIPSGAALYALSLRVPDMRKDRGVGTAFSGLVGTNTNRLKVANALANDDELIDNNISTKSSDVAVSSGTIAPVSTIQTIDLANSYIPALQTAARTLKVYVTTSAGNVAGSTLTSTQAGGTPIIVDAYYYLNDDPSELNDIWLPFINESA
jgi:hypothetical protein